MVNCNPETVSTDYDTSDRLYFEPLSPEEVLAVCDREQPVGVVTQFGGQTPLRARARTSRRPATAILGHAARRRSTSPRTASASARSRDELGVRCPPWAIVDGARRGARGRPSEIGYPVLVRPSYVLGGRAMRVCYDDDAARGGDGGRQRARVLVDRFVENAIEIDVDALCDGEDVYIAAVMQHVEEAGVHSGDSACVLPAPSLTLAERARGRARRQAARRRRSASSGSSTSSSRSPTSTVYVLEANPRASRTVPFASKAIGVNLVEAACRLAAGADARASSTCRRRGPRR